MTVGSFVGSFWRFQCFSGFLTVKLDRKSFGLCKNNGIEICPLLQISPLFQGKTVIMDAIKLMKEKFRQLLIRRSLVQVQQGEPGKTRFLSCLSFCPYGRENALVVHAR